MQTPRFVIEFQLSVYAPILIRDSTIGELDWPFYNTEWVLLKAYQNLYNKLDSLFMPNTYYFDSGDNLS